MLLHVDLNIRRYRYYRYYRYRYCIVPVKYRYAVKIDQVSHTLLVVILTVRMGSPSVSEGPV